MKVSIVIPNYNGEILLKKNLPTVFATLSWFVTGKNATGEIIVTDDASTDASASAISNLKSQISNQKINFTYLESEKNTGFSSNVDRGVAKATGDIVVLLNTDVSPDKEFLEPLLSHFSDENVFAVACMDKSVEEGGIVLRGRGVGKWERGFLHHAAGSLDKKNTLWASGGSSAFRKSMWDKLGGLNKLYNPFYWEDIDLSYRAQKAGYKIIFEKRAAVVHEHEKGAIKKKYSPSDVKKIAYRNQFFFIWTNVTDAPLVISHIVWLPYHLLTAVARGDMLFI
ncbi:MAG TPA: glycosyltransferase family 2 protein, partial [Candidatus Saccharimonadales bacterium]|nr:glycosyltransferase family 2 protein [Candidatus Saccharimonadales bacterium]